MAAGRKNLVSEWRGGKSLRSPPVEQPGVSQAGKRRQLGIALLLFAVLALAMNWPMQVKMGHRFAVPDGDFGLRLLERLVVCRGSGQLRKPVSLGDDFSSRGPEPSMARLPIPGHGGSGAHHMVVWPHGGLQLHLPGHLCIGGMGRLPPGPLSHCQPPGRAWRRPGFRLHSGSLSELRPAVQQPHAVAALPGAGALEAAGHGMAALWSAGRHLVGVEFAQRSLLRRVFRLCHSGRGALVLVGAG